MCVGGGGGGEGGTFTHVCGTRACARVYVEDMTRGHVKMKCTKEKWYISCQLLSCRRMFLYVFVCNLSFTVFVSIYPYVYSYVTRMYSYVTSMYLCVVTTLFAFAKEKFR